MDVLTEGFVRYTERHYHSVIVIELIMPPQQQTIAPRRSLETISVWALLATLVAAIFFFLPYSAVPFATTKTFLLAAGTLITLALYILARLGRGNVIFPPLLLVGALWLPVIAYALSATFSGTMFTNALWGSALEPDTLGFILMATVLGTLSALVLRRPEHYNVFLRAGAYVFGVLTLLQALVVIVGQFAPNTVSPAFSIIGSFDDLAVILGFGVIGVLIAFRFLGFSGKVRQMLGIVSVVALVLLAIANSPLIWTLVALVSLGLFVEAVMQRGSKTVETELDDAAIMSESPLETGESSHSLVVPLAVLAISLFFLIGGTLGDALANAVHVNILNVRPSWQSTLAVGQNVFATAPVFGTGPGTFGVEWLKYRDAALNSTVFWNVDFSSGIGFIPTSFVTTGLVGIVAWIAFFGLFLVLGLRMLILRAPQDAATRFFGIFSFIASVYLFAIAIFGLPNTIVLALAFVFAGLFISSMRFAEGGQQWGIIFARSPRIGFVIVFSLTIVLLVSVIAAYSLVGHYIATSSLANAGTSFSAGSLDDADRSAQNAISFAPSSAAYQIQAGVASTRLDQIAASTTMTPTEAQQAFQAALSGGINAALTATRLTPSDYQNWLALGNLYSKAVPLGVTGAYESAKTAYEKARELNPTNPQIPYILAQLDIANKNIKGAKENLKVAITLKQDYTAAIFLLSQLEVQDGNVKEALAAALAAAYFTPNDPNILFQVGILRAAEGDFAGSVSALSASVAANPQFANARYFLSAVYAKQGNFKSALEQMQAIADMSADNARTVATQLTALTSGKNPFPANLLSVSPAPVK
ncbi:MAG: Tfp pilus assembly protein PilF [Parcubacteria group bacterium Gr01-1014_49]|nr:MAG: Tfp pilus assembly protein PilF [Parcubacteria group bacterium Gr01-1014_49]